MTIKVVERQTIFDLALQYCGAMEAAFEIAQLNGLSLTDELADGDELVMPQAIKPAIVQHYAVNNIQPATGQTSDEINAELGIGEGIEFWAIEYDFIVS